MINANIDFIGKGKSSGEIAAQFASNQRLEPDGMRPYIGKDGRSYISVHTGGDKMNPKNYRAVPINTNATLRRDEWKQLDEAVLKISEQRLGGVQDLIDKGLVYNLGNAMGTTVLEWHTMSDALNAELTMDAITRGQNDGVDYNHHYLPIPIIHVDYEINTRTLNASRNLGNPLDTSNAERAARKVNEKLEEMLFTDTDYTFGGGSIKSYINHTDRNTVTLGTNWDSSSKSGSDIVDDVMNMKQTSINNYHYGPWMLYIPTAYETEIDKDYDARTPGTTVRERIMKISNIQGVKVVDKLPANNVLLVEMNTDTVRLIRGMGIQNVEWKQEGGMMTNYKVMTIQVPQIRSDDNGRTGIVHLA